MMRRYFGCLGLVLVAAALAYWGHLYVRDHPQDVPWTQLQLTDPVGRFTGRKLAGLQGESQRCRELLSLAGADYVATPPRRDGANCGYSNGMRLRGEQLDFAPAGPVAACPVAAAIFLFENQVLQPAAIHHFGQRVARIAHAGTYSCRRLYGRSEGSFSEHATANAFDITGFVLENGRTVSVERDWGHRTPPGAFLRTVRDGACDLFSTVLSPDYNEAHADHLHFDQAQRGSAGWRVCR
jgi:hypothetical protein